MKSLARDERGLAILQIVAIIVAPIIMLMLAGATINAIRTGTGITEALTRNAQSQIMFTDFKNSVAGATTVTAPTANRVTLTSDPSRLPPGVALDAGTTCVTTTWELLDDGNLRTFARTTQTHQSTCTSPVKSETTQKLTGLAPATKFELQNTAGRILTHTGSTLTPAAGFAPAGVSAGAWASTDIGAIVLDGAVQEMLSDRDIRITAVTTPTRVP